MTLHMTERVLRPWLPLLILAGAEGQTPLIEVVLTTPREPYRIFVQEPGTLGRSLDMDTGRRSLIAAAAPARKNTTNPVTEVPVAIFGLGSTPVSGMPDLQSSDL